jgi:hypothetical protein
LVGIVERKRVEAALLLAVFLGVTIIAVRPVFGAPVFISVEVPYSVCVIQLGVEESGGTVTWLAGYAYPGTPISECKDKTDVFGEDTLGRTIMFHQFIMNGTGSKLVAVEVA